MAGEFGLSFSPTEQNHAENAKQGQTPIADAIKVLSLRIPQFNGARGLAPDALMGGPGAGGVPGASAPGGIPGGLDDWLRRMLMGMGNPMGGGQMPPQGMPQGVPPQGAPAPRITPGEEQRHPTPVGSGPDPLIGGIVNPGSFQPPGSPRPPMQIGRSPMQRLG